MQTYSFKFKPQIPRRHLSVMAIAVGYLFINGPILAKDITTGQEINVGEDMTWDNGDTLNLLDASVVVNGGTLRVGLSYLPMSTIKHQQATQEKAGIVVRNNGVISGTIGGYEYKGDLPDSNALRIESGGTVTLDNSVINTVEGKGGYSISVSGQGSELSLKRTLIGAAGSNVLDVRDGAKVTLDEVTIDNMGLALPLASFAPAINITGGGQLFINNSYLNGVRPMDPNNPRRIHFISVSDEDGGAYLSMKNVEINAGNQNSMLHVAKGGVADVVGILIEQGSYYNPLSAAGTPIIVEDSGVLNLTDARFYISGPYMEAGILVDGGLVNIVEMSFDYQDAMAIKLQGKNGYVNIRDSDLSIGRAADKDLAVIRFLDGSKAEPNQVDMHNVRIDGSDVWAVDAQDGYGILNVSGGQSMVTSYDEGALMVMAKHKETVLNVTLADQAKMSGDVTAMTEHARPATLNLNLNTQAQWQGDAVVDTDQARVNVDVATKAKWQGDALASGAGASVGVRVSDQGEWDGEAIASAPNALVDVTVAKEGVWQRDASVDVDGAKVAVTVTDDGLWHGQALASGSGATAEVTVHNGGEWTGEAVASSRGALVNVVVGKDGIWQRDAKVDVDGAKVAVTATDAGVWAGDAIATSAGAVVQVTADQQGRWTGTVAQDNVGQTHVAVKNAGQWVMSVDAKADSLTLANQGEVVMGSGAMHAGNRRQLQVGDLLGSNGLFRMRADMGEQIGDLVSVSGRSAGSHTLSVRNNGAAKTTGTERLPMVTTTDGGATFALKNAVEQGGYEYGLHKIDTDWVLMRQEAPEIPPEEGGGTINKPASTAANFLNIGYLMNYIDTQTLWQRMGDMRSGQAEVGQAWGRVFAGQVDSFDTGKLHDFDMDYSGFQVGTDREVAVSSGTLYAGVMAGYTLARPDFATGTGKAKGHTLGLYGTYLHNDGWYLDGLLKYARMNYDFDVKDSAGDQVSGATNGNGYGASVEVGKRFDLANQMYVAPQAQLSYFRQGSSNSTLDNGLNVKLDGYNSTLARVGTMIGYDVQQGAQPLSVYAKLGYVRELSGDTRYYLNGSQERHDFGGGWLDLGLGVTAQVNKVHHLYGELSHQNGSRFNKSQLNLGYRHQF